MPLPRPEPGLVIHFGYLWRHEHEAGQEDGSTSRPCLIVMAVSYIRSLLLEPSSRYRRRWS
jgi:hypothetical protein